MRKKITLKDLFEHLPKEEIEKIKNGDISYNIGGKLVL